MAEYTPNELNGNLFKNDKGDNPARPDYRGDAMVNGVIYKMAAWIKESANGTKYMSIKFDPKEGAAAPAPVKQQAAVDDTIPF